MRLFLTLVFSIVSALGLMAQNASNFWVVTPEAQLKTNPDLEREIIPDAYQTFELNLDGLKSYLRNAPMEGTRAAKRNPLQVDFPMPDGQVRTFEVWEAPIMHPDLAARYPMVKTFRGKNVKTGATIAFDYGTAGFHGSIRYGKTFYYIDPYAFGDTKNYILYDVKDDNTPNNNPTATACGFNPDVHGTDFAGSLDIENLDRVQARSADVVELKKYIMVFACTGEFANRVGGDEEDVLSAYAAMMVRLNQIYQMEFAATFELHPDTDRVIFLNPNTDPYPDGNTGGAILGINANVVNGRINRNTYDISHAFTARCDDVGGVASLGSLCNQNASGMTCHSSSSVTFTVVNITAHEVGHQFSCSHTWDNCGSPQRSTPYEPGSGTTIMSYAGLCGPQNIVNNVNDDYFHVNSIMQARTFTTQANGATCAEVIVTDNHLPEIQMPYTNGFYIPNGTPFELEASATDEDGDNVTYCWEQFDLHPTPVDIGNPQGNSPIYRSYPPSADNNRFFPRLGTILGYQDTLPWEMSARYAREMTFRLTVRDNNPDAGGVTWEEVNFRLDDNQTPFAVVSPGNDVDTVAIGEQLEVTWDVADSYDAPVNCKAVNIFLSLDGGYTWPIVLAESTQNDGSEFVPIPEVALSDRCRIKVEAANNIFFNVSQFNFEIIEPTAPGFIASINPTFHYACLPELFRVDIETAGFLGYDSTLTIEVLNLPQGATASFTNTTVQPGETVSLDLVLPNGLGSGFKSIDLLIYANGSDTLATTIDLELVSNDFESIAFISPSQGEDGVSELPVFSWSGAPDADFYELQIATNPNFSPGTIVFDETNLVDTFYQPETLLDENSPYYWRIRPVNICGPGAYKKTGAFHTFAKVCKTYVGLEGDNQRIPISGQGTPTIESTISILDNGTINDINIPFIRGSYEPIDRTQMRLKSPSGNSIILFEKRCGGSVFNMGFDDAIPNRNPCPANSGRVVGPQEFLSAFNSEPLNGVWTLEWEVLQAGFGGGGSLEEWQIEFCANSAPDAPFIFNNNELPVRPGFGRIVSNAFLEVRDSSSGPDDLIFTLVTIPENGKLTLAGRELQVGDQFRQASINVNNVYYLHDGSATTIDNFTFTVRDDEGGWLATPQFNFVMDDDAIVSTNSPDLEKEVKVFPNPANEFITVDLGVDFDGEMDIHIVSIAGQLVKSMYLDRPARQFNINTANLPGGMYILQLKGDDALVSRKINIQR